jgi:hypothetical protein
MDGAFLSRGRRVLLRLTAGHDQHRLIGQPAAAAPWLHPRVHASQTSRSSSAPTWRELVPLSPQVTALGAVRQAWPERARSGKNEAAEGARRSVAESEKMSNRTIALLVLAVVVAAAVTVEVTYFVLDRFVLHDPNDPLTKAGGLSQDQKAKRK